MKPKLFEEKFNNLFNWFSNESSPGLLKMKLGIHKKLLNFFLLGDSYHFIINHNTFKIELVSKELEQIMGWTPSEFGIDCMNKNLHPDDQGWFLSFGDKIIEFFSHLPLEKLQKYKLRYDIRFKKRNGEYARLLYQGVIIENDENGRLLRSLGMHTDITYLKKEGRPILSFIGMDGEPSYVDVCSQNIFIESKEELTKREKQVLKLLIGGKLSKEIGDILSISKQTVDTHRKNILHKKKISRTGELVGKAISYGWI